MNDILVDLFNNVGAGTFLIIIISLGGLGASVIYTVYKAYKAIETKVKKSTTEEIEEDRQMTEITTSINNMSDQIGLLHNGVNKLTENQEQFIAKLQDMQKKMEEESASASLADEALTRRIDSISTKIGQINEKQTMLIESDKINIRSKITEVYYEAMEDSFIDPHTLQNLEEQYKKYLEENGNAFAGELMNELRKLPHTKPKTE